MLEEKPEKISQKVDFKNTENMEEKVMKICRSVEEFQLTNKELKEMQKIGNKRNNSEKFPKTESLQFKDQATKYLQCG